MLPERKLFVFIAMSLDGYIAAPNDDLSFLSIVSQEGEDYGYLNFMKDIDTVIVGRKTYDWVMKQVPEFPHADKKTFVITRTEKEPSGNIQFYSGSLKELLQHLKAEPGKHIFCDGGADVINALLQDNLVDEWILSIIPVLLGKGVRLFGDGRPWQELQLMSSRSFEKGLVQLHYRRKDQRDSV
jgi:dihydrofolate reductase